MAAAERRAREGLRRTLLTERYFRLLDSLEAFVADPPLRKRAGRPASEEMPKIARRAWRKVTGRSPT